MNTILTVIGFVLAVIAIWTLIAIKLAADSIEMEIRLLRKAVTEATPNVKHTNEYLSHILIKLQTWDHPR